MKHVIFLLAAFACLAAGCSTAQHSRMVRIEAAGLRFSNGEEDRRAFGAAMRALLLQGDFDRLDRIADSLRASGERCTDGTSKLRCFYRMSFDEPDGEKWSESQWGPLLHQLRVWRETRRRSITARVALGHALVGYAWNARGSGYAFRVSRRGWQLMSERLDQAHVVLMDARQLPTSCPGWYSAEQRVALGQGWGRAAYDSLFEEAIARHPDFEAYYTLKAYHLLPRWYGKPGEWEVFATEIASRLPDSLGARIYAHILRSQAEYYDNIFEDTAVSWPRAKQGFRLLEADFPSSVEILSEFAYFACCAGDREEAKRLFKRIGARVELGVWTDDQAFLRARAWARMVYG